MGSCPPELTLNSARGEISRSPSQASTSIFTITVADFSDASVSQTYSIGIQSKFALPSYDYLYVSYIYAYDAFATGTGLLATRHYRY